MSKTDELDHTLRRWTCDCDPWLEGLKLAAECTQSIEVTEVAVKPHRPPSSDGARRKDG